MVDNVDLTRTAPSMPQAPVDPNMHLPAAAARAAALAESYYKQSATTPAPTKDAVAQPVPLIPPQDAPAVQPAPAPEQPDYEHMYRSMKGRFDQQNTVNAQLAEELRQQQLFNQRMREEFDALKNPPQPRQYVTDEERQTYGNEFFDVVAKRVQEVVGDKLEMVERLNQENEALKQRLQKTANQTLAQIVGAQVPNWRELNNDPGFIQWLSLRDVYSGESRNGLLQKATRRSDAPAIIAFYRGYLAETGQLKPTPQSAEAPHPAAPRQSAVELEQLVAPGAPRPATIRPDLAPQKRIYTRREIAAYFDQKRRGMWAGREADTEALERDFVLAASENRVQG